MTDITTTTYIDALGRVCADVVDGLHVFAAGVTVAVIDAAPEVVPLSDDFAELGLPLITLALGPWAPVLRGSDERLTVTVNGAIWTARVPVAENVNILYALRDALANAFIAHTKAYSVEAALQSAILMGGPGIVPRAIGDPPNRRLYATLPFTVENTFNRPVSPQPS